MSHNPVIYAVVDPDEPDAQKRVLPVKGTDNGDGTCSLDTTGGGGGGPGGTVVVTEAPITWDVNFGATDETPNTSTEAAPAIGTGAIYRIELSVDAPASIFVSIGIPATVGYDEIKPGGEWSCPYMTVDAINVISETGSVPYRLSVGTYD